MLSTGKTEQDIKEVVKFECVKNVESWRPYAISGLSKGEGIYEVLHYVY